MKLFPMTERRQFKFTQIGGQNNKQKQYHKQTNTECETFCRTMELVSSEVKDMKKPKMNWVELKTI